MKEKVRNFIYFGTQNYISLDTLRMFYWGTILIPFVMAVIGFAAIHTRGSSWKALFPLVSVVVWSILYWTFILSIQSNRIKKTFELRFLVNGISGLLFSSLVWSFYTSFNINADNPIFEFDFSLWILFFYLLFSVTYIGLIVRGIHKDVYKKIRKKKRFQKLATYDVFAASLIPISGVSGMIVSKLLKEHTNISFQNIIITIGCIFLIFMPAVSNINFVKYYYCKKYKILCDEYGKAASPMLERQVKPKKEKKKLPLFAKILIAIAIYFFVFFIKGIIQGIA